MSSAAWFKRAKAALALVEWLENLRLAAGVLLDVAVDSYLRWDPAEVEVGRRLLREYRRATPDNFTPRGGPRERRRRTDSGREQDTRDAVPAKPF